MFSTTVLLAVGPLVGFTSLVANMVSLLVLRLEGDVGCAMSSTMLPNQSLSLSREVCGLGITPLAFFRLR